MGFDFASAIKQGEADSASAALELMILGQSGAGKSHIIGTLGVPTLYLYLSGEKHGIKSAKTEGKGHVYPVCIDHDGSNSLFPDAAYSRLLSILSDVDGLRKGGFKAIAIDGATELEALIRGTDVWRRMCLSAKEKHNPFEEPRATITMFRPVINGLKNAQRALDCHVMLTCILDVKEYGTFNEVVECGPRLLGYSVAETLVQQFGDIIVVGLMKKGGDVKPKIQFMTEIAKTSKNEDGVVKKTINFSPRLSGLSIGDLPPMLDASLKSVVELKASKAK